MRSQPLVKLAWAIDCSSLEQTFGAVYEDQRVGLLMAGPATLKHTCVLPEEGLCVSNWKAMRGQICARH
jgi:hypothetical protein